MTSPYISYGPSELIRTIKAVCSQYFYTELCYREQKHLNKTTMRNLILMVVFALLSTSLNLSCNASRKVQGAIIGAVVGGTTGALITKKNKAAGIILGAGVGGAAGAIIGNYMDKQAREIADELENAHVERVGEGIVIIFDSGLLFDFDSYDLRPATKENLAQLANTLQKYEETELNILGHTDNVGDQAYNQSLSVNRADAVVDYLVSNGVPSQRLQVLGYGETDPIADNDTEEGRQLNRRVEIVIVANDELKEAAKEGQDISSFLN